MAKMNKTEAIFFLSQHNKTTGFMANVVQYGSQFKGHAAMLIKYMAHMVAEGFDLSVVPHSIEPCVNGKQMTWKSLRQIGEALYNEEITKEQVIGLIKEL